jgi:phosphoribosyl-AMP cyclohydrolase
MIGGSAGLRIMMAFASPAPPAQTKKATFWSRSRNKFWIKGEESGNVQKVKDLFYDCDSDCLLLKVDQVGGAACHTGYRSCFYRKLGKGAAVKVVGKRVFDPDKVYAAKTKSK